MDLKETAQKMKEQVEARGAAGCGGDSTRASVRA
jgi:hypothetical protein